jgi:hypothetical protein
VSLFVEYVYFVNCLVIVCLFISWRLDDKQNKENGSRSQPNTGDADDSTQDEDEDYFEFANQGKPSFESYPNTQFSNLHIYLLPN